MLVRRLNGGENTDSVFSWAGCIVFACAAVSVADMLITDSSVAKTARFVFGVILLCAVIVPVASVVETLGKIDIPSVSEYSESEDMLMLQKETAEKRLSELAESTLEKKGITGVDCKANLICSDGEFTSVRCSVQLDSNNKSQRNKVTEIIKNELGMDVDFPYE